MGYQIWIRPQFINFDSVWDFDGKAIRALVAADSKLEWTGERSSEIRWIELDEHGEFGQSILRVMESGERMALQVHSSFAMGGGCVPKLFEIAAALQADIVGDDLERWVMWHGLPTDIDQNGYILDLRTGERVRYEERDS